SWLRPFSFSSVCRRPPCPPLFPYTTLFRSRPLSLRTSRGEAVYGIRRATVRPWLVMEKVSPFSTRRRISELLLRSSRCGIVLMRSEEHTSELQSRFDLVCRLLLEKKNKTQT